LPLHGVSLNGLIFVLFDKQLFFAAGASSIACSVRFAAEILCQWWWPNLFNQITPDFATPSARQHVLLDLGNGFERDR